MNRVEEAVALTSAMRKATFHDQACAIIAGSVELAFDALRLVVARGVQLELAMTLIVTEIDDEMLSAETSALGIAVTVLRGQGIEIPRAWLELAEN